jgi:hypothetical protein
MRLVAEAGFVAAELLVLPRLDADEAFFSGTRLFPLRGFSLPVTVSTNAVTALDAISFVAAMFILAASVNASGIDVISPSFSLSIVTSLCSSGKRHTDLRRAVQQEKLCGVEALISNLSAWRTHSWSKSFQTYGRRGVNPCETPAPWPRAAKAYFVGSRRAHASSARC